MKLFVITLVALAVAGVRADIGLKLRQQYPGIQTTYGVPNYEHASETELLDVKQTLELPAPTYGAPFHQEETFRPANSYEVPLNNVEGASRPSSSYIPQPAPLQAPVPHQTYGAPSAATVPVPVRIAPKPVLRQQVMPAKIYGVPAPISHPIVEAPSVESSVAYVPQKVYGAPSAPLPVAQPVPVPQKQYGVPAPAATSVSVAAAGSFQVPQPHYGAPAPSASSASFATAGSFQAPHKVYGAPSAPLPVAQPAPVPQKFYGVPAQPAPSTSFAVAQSVPVPQKHYGVPNLVASAPTIQVPQRTHVPAVTKTYLPPAPQRTYEAHPAPSVHVPQKVYGTPVEHHQPQQSFNIPSAPVQIPIQRRPVEQPAQTYLPAPSLVIEESHHVPMTAPAAPIYASNGGYL